MYILFDSLKQTDTSRHEDTVRAFRDQHSSDPPSPPASSMHAIDSSLPIGWSTTNERPTYRSAASSTAHEPVTYLSPAHKPPTYRATTHEAVTNPSTSREPGVYRPSRESPARRRSDTTNVKVKHNPPHYGNIQQAADRHAHERNQAHRTPKHGRTSRSPITSERNPYDSIVNERITHDRPFHGPITHERTCLGIPRSIALRPGTNCAVCGTSKAKGKSRSKRKESCSESPSDSGEDWFVFSE